MKKSVYLLEGYQALGTVWYIELFEQLPSDRLEVLRNDVIQEIISFENKYSRFKSDSLLSLLNKNRTLPYDEDLALMISLAKDAHTKSDGIFDIFIKHKLEQKGYGGTGDILQGVEEKSTAHSSEETIILTGTQSIDLGGIGKGFLIDKISRYAQSQGVKEFIVNGGGDMYVLIQMEMR